ncbi:hypothetical protein CLV51_1021158 [Chitinophaga niastensis]|uniref:Uncharacterized protein n=1 Tax=Chitinophaga niastensis TaxID=536980 RepID=A0A2P8HPZ6_CHINA|nr:hypothetical protein [Chitinophaga niastensis]PSL48291.1 hypothetical protein CLV51_1021158 [Chitinophaga niastensis]
MFIGHFGLGMVTKKIAPKISLGTLFMAVQFSDLIWPTLLLLGVEKVVLHPELGGTRTITFTSYPFTHSLVGALVLAVLFGTVYYVVKKNFRNALILGAAVLSHWFLDFIVHFHDLPLFPASSVKVGLALWATIGGTLFVELILFISGIVLYLRSTTPLNAKARIIFWINILLLVSVQISNFWGPPPASVNALAWSAQFQWLFVILAYWADNNTQSATTGKSIERF